MKKKRQATGEVPASKKTKTGVSSNVVVKPLTKTQQCEEIVTKARAAIDQEQLKQAKDKTADIVLST